MKTTRMKSITIQAFPAWSGKVSDGGQGWFFITIQYMNKDGERVYQEVKIDQCDLSRVLLAQQALVNRVEEQIVS